MEIIYHFRRNTTANTVFASGGLAAQTWNFVLHSGKLISASSMYSGLKKLDRNFVTLKFLSYEKIEKNI